MYFSFKGFLYSIFIDPLVKGLRNKVVSVIVPGEEVIDIACGTGALSLEMSGRAGHVTGIDLSEDMITTARLMAKKRKASNVSFHLLDATDLSCYSVQSFDTAVSVLAMHQFDPETGVKVLREMKRTARGIIIADYNCPMKPGPASLLAWVIERIAGGDHYRNFRLYMAGGGIQTLAGKAGLAISSREERGGGVFIITLLTPEGI